MEYLNIFGCVFIFIIMIPNIVLAIKRKYEFQSKWNDKFLEIGEQIGRFGCF